MRPAVPEVEHDEASSTGNASPRRALLGTAVGLGVFAAVPLLGRMFSLRDAIGAPSKAQDAKILQLVLQLEYTQVAFYEAALRDAGLTGELRDFAQTALAHERAHLAAIKNALGAKAGSRPAFDFGQKTKSADAFTQAAIDLEDVAVAGYNGQATNLTKGTLVAAAEIVSVEARHAAWVRAIAGEVAAPDPVDKPMTAREVARGLHDIGLRA
jgi:ferritin-like protein